MRRRRRPFRLQRAIAIAIIVGVRWSKMGAVMLGCLLAFALWYTVVVGGTLAFLHFTGLAYVQTGPDDRDPDRLW
jgi:hypothetical protein